MNELIAVGFIIFTNDYGTIFESWPPKGFGSLWKVQPRFMDFPSSYGFPISEKKLSLQEKQQAWCLQACLQKDPLSLEPNVIAGEASKNCPKEHY